MMNQYVGSTYYIAKPVELDKPNDETDEPPKLPVGISEDTNTAVIVTISYWNEYADNIDADTLRFDDDDFDDLVTEIQKVFMHLY